MEGVTCPSCHHMFAMMSLSDDDFDEDSDLVTCPFCMCSFDPNIKRSASEAESQSTSLDELVDLDDGEDE